MPKLNVFLRKNGSYYREGLVGLSRMEKVKPAALRLLIVYFN